MNMGERMARALELAGKTRGELAAAMRTSVQAVGQLLNGQTKALSAENCARAAAFLRIDCFWLATGEGSPDAGTKVASPRERELLDLFGVLPDDEQDELLRSLGERADRYRKYAEQIRERMGIKPMQEPEVLSPPRRSRPNGGPQHLPSRRGKGRAA